MLKKLGAWLNGLLVRGGVEIGIDARNLREKLYEIEIPKGTQEISLWSLNKHNMMFPLFIIDLAEHGQNGWDSHLFQLRCTGHKFQLNEMPLSDFVSTPQVGESLQDTNDLTGGNPALGNQSEAVIVTLFIETGQSN